MWSKISLRSAEGDPSPVGLPEGESIVSLDHPLAVDPRLCGAKAAALADAVHHGLPVVPGFVVTTLAVAALTEPEARQLTIHELPHQLPGLRRAWEELGGDRRPLVVRSSSTIEDQAGTSMAGRFTTVVGVEGWDGLLDAVAAVVASRAVATGDSPVGNADRDMAVLVQPLIDSSCGGVAFGIDPVSGRSDRVVVTSVAGQPEQLVSGTRSGNRYVLTMDGRIMEHDEPDSDAVLPRRRLRSVLDLTLAASHVFGTPQDIEWSIDRDGTLWLLQSRPVTTGVAGVPQGPVLGPGPVAETFPDPLSRLEIDLWVEPLRTGMGEAFRLSAGVPPAQLAASPLVVTIDGRVAVDLELFEADSGSWLERRLRILRAAWRTGRLRAALPDLARDVVTRTDTELLAVPALPSLSDRQLVALLRRLRPVLHAVHGYEMLMGLLVDRSRGPRLTAASVGVRTLARARADGLDDEVIVSRHPAVLTLSAPRIGPSIALPPSTAVTEWQPGADEDWPAVLREALRLRARWCQELGARAAWELGQRLTQTGILDEPARVRHIDLDELEMIVRGLAVPVLVAGPVETPPPPLPARFRLTDRGQPLAEHQGGQGPVGAGGGRGQGPIHRYTGIPGTGTAGTSTPDPGAGLDAVPEGSVLVVTTLRPDLAPVLPRLNGLVAETGSVLSHLAILAREHGVPTVVGYREASSLPQGATAVVDGTTGEVSITTDSTTDSTTDG